MMTQVESATLITPPPFISASNPFVALSRAVKDGCLLVATPSSIPITATWGPNVNLSPNEGSEEVFEYFDDEPVVNTQVFDSNEASNDEHVDTQFCTHNLILENG